MDGRRLEDGSPLGPRSAVAELGSRQPPPEAGQARTTMPRLLEVTRRWKVPVARYPHELTQATPSDVPPERRNDVLRVDRIDRPKPAFLRYGLNVGCPNQPTICKSLVRPRANVTEYHANGTARMNMDIHQVGRDQPVVVLIHCFGDAKEIEVRVALFVEID